MADESGVASFQFISYKIDRVKLNVAQNVTVLAINTIPDLSDMDFRIGIRNSSKFLSNNTVCYIGGINVDITIRDSKQDEILNGSFGIAGLFSSNNMDEQSEENMVRINIPAILLPYLRSSITTILSQAGFGTIVLPLINIYEIAKNNPIRIQDLSPPEHKINISQAKDLPNGTD
jgi:preprotein translocase subunit SecB